MKRFRSEAAECPENGFRLEVGSDRRVLPWISHGLRGYLRANGWPRREAFRIELALNEALDNAIVHGNRADTSKPVVLNVREEGDALVLEIHDGGRGFDPDAVQPIHERNERLQEGGRGVALMRRLMDEVEVDCGPEGTRVRMRKVRRPADLRKAS